MISVYIKKQGNFPISTLKIKRTLREFFTREGIVSNADVNILFVGKSRMEKIGKKYISRNEPLHNVLSFVETENCDKFTNPPDEILHLGDIALCYPLAVEEANKDGVLVEEKVIELLQHASYHLLGKHHEESKT